MFHDFFFTFHFILAFLSTICGFLSAFFWFWAGKVKISRKTAIERIEKRAKENGEKPNLSGVEFDGFDVRETLRDQFKYNSIAAFLAAAAIGFQTLNQIF